MKSHTAQVTARIFSSGVCYLAFLLLPSATLGQHPVQSSVATKSEAQTVTVSERPQMFDPDAMDKTVDPCEDFYEYACGTWLKNNPIPSDQVFWARYNQLGEYNRQVLHKILEEAAVVQQRRSPAARIAGDFYTSCIDQKDADRRGYEPLKPELARIAAISNREQLMQAVAHLHAIGVHAAFEFSAQPDLHDATMQTAVIAQGGLGLPDRDYYLNQDEKSQQTRAKYLAHISTMFQLTGEEAGEADRASRAVLDLETRLAGASFERAKMRDPKNRDHKMTVSDLDRVFPNLLFQRFFQAVGAAPIHDIYVAPPDFFQALNTAMDAVSLDEWRAYLRWRLIQLHAPFLSDVFVQEDFAFERRYLNGQRDLEPRWKRCVSAADRLLGEALGRVYVEKTFRQADKERVMAMVKLEEQVLADDIQALPWMTGETKQKAILKLQAITNKVGYPEKWIDYREIKIRRNDLLGNIDRIHQFELKRNLKKIGKPTDKQEWIVTTPTVNAYYYPPENSINFPAGVLQSPLFDPSKDDAVNFGAIGWLIGHELTHGFDDQGSKFDGQGNLTNWWTQNDREEFDKRTSCIADQYQQFIVVDDIHLNGRLTLGENTADNGGIRIALAALHKSMANKNAAQALVDGFTPDQRFFISFAQQWCANVTPERLRVITKVDPHAPVRFRTLGTLGNYQDFATAFGCKTGQAMISTNSCRVW